MTRDRPMLRELRRSDKSRSRWARRKTRDRRAQRRAKERRRASV